MTKHLEQIKQPEKGKVGRCLNACSGPFDLVRQNKAGPSAGRRNKTLQKITKLYKTLQSTAFSRVRQGAVSWSWWPSRRDFRCFLGLLPDRSLAGRRPMVPSVTPILVLCKQRLGDSHNCNLHVHHPRQLRQIIMMFLHTKILDITHSNSVIYVQKVKRLTWPILIRNSRRSFSTQWHGLKND